MVMLSQEFQNTAMQSQQLDLCNTAMNTSHSATDVHIKAKCLFGPTLNERSVDQSTDVT